MNSSYLFIIISIAVLLLILMLSYIEMNNCKTHAMLAIDIKQLNKNPTIVLTPDMLPIKNNAYIYSTTCSEMVRPHVGYVKDDICEHVASSIMNPIKEVINKVKKIKNSTSPINTIYSAVTKASDVVSISTLSSTPETKYILEHHPNDNITAFISDDFIYFV